MDWISLLIWGFLAYMIISNAMEHPNSPIAKMVKKAWNWIRGKEGE